MKKFGLLFLLLLLSSFSFSQPLLEENFNFTGLLTDNGWTAHSGAGTEAVNTTTGLVYSDYASSNIGNAALLDNNGEDVNRTFTAQTSGIIYYSFLVNVTTGTAGYFIHLGNTATTFAARIFVKPSVTVDKINFGISNTSTASYAATPTDFDLLTTYLVIVKYDVSTFDASLWVLSSGVPISEAAAGTPEHITTETGQASIGMICLRQYNATQNITVDGIRVATTWDEAPLPVELTSFSASVIGSAVKLNWVTASELNNYGFDIERTVISNEVRNLSWEKIGFVEGYGTSISPKDYSFTDASVISGTYSYRLKQIDNNGTFSYSKIIEVDLGAPKKYELAQNFPNPFNPNTAIKFTLPETGNVKLTVYNMLGQEITTLVNGVKEAGTHIINFNAEELNSGIYIYRIESNGFNEVRKMTLIK